MVPLQFRGDVEARWTEANPVLPDRVVGLETDTQRFKVGNGITRWNNLAYWISEVFTDTEDPTGFIDNENIGVSYDSTTRRITLTHSSGMIEYYWRGIKKGLVSPWVSDAHADTAPTKYLYSTNGSSFAWSDTPWEFNKLMVAFVAPSKIFAIREVHGVMPISVHEELHRLLSTYRLSGFGLTTGTYTLQNDSDANNTPGFDAGIIVDEDLKSDILAFTQGSYTLLSFSGSGTPVFSTAQVSMLRAITGTYPNYNNWDGATFSDVEMSTGQFANIYILRFPVTSDVTSQLYRAVCLQPQRVYTSLASAEAEDFRGLYLGTLSTLSPEFVAVERITIRTNASYASTGRFRLESTAILSGSRASQVAVAGFTSLTAQNVSVVPFSTISSTNVQQALEEIVSEAGTGSGLTQEQVEGFI